MKFIDWIRHTESSGVRTLCGTIVVMLLLPILLSGCISSTTANAQIFTTPSAPSPPSQPADGPGGSNYKHDTVVINSYETGVAQYWLFEPASPTPQSAPVIVFNHGWLGISPESYGAWIEHLVRKGNIVVHPAYQRLDTPTEEMTGNAVTAVKNALERLGNGGHVTPALEKFALVGHSLGGVISVNMAATASLLGIPKPSALMLALPGDAGNVREDTMTDLSLLPPDVLILSVVCSEDIIVGGTYAQRIMRETSQVPDKNKDIVTMFSDFRGTPPLIADHLAPLAIDMHYGSESSDIVQQEVSRSIYGLLGAEPNALDYYGFWKLSDGLIDAAFYGKNREYALGNTKEQRFMGYWSDGKPVKELKSGWDN